MLLNDFSHVRIYAKVTLQPKSACTMLHGLKFVIIVFYYMAKREKLTILRLLDLRTVAKQIKVLMIQGKYKHKLCIDGNRNLCRASTIGGQYCKTTPALRRDVITSGRYL